MTTRPANLGQRVISAEEMFRTLAQVGGRPLCRGEIDALAAHGSFDGVAELRQAVMALALRETEESPKWGKATLLEMDDSEDCGLAVYDYDDSNRETGELARFCEYYGLSCMHSHIAQWGCGGIARCYVLQHEHTFRDEA